MNPATILVAHRALAAVTAFAAFYAVSWKFCALFLKWLAHSSIAVPAAAATLPPFPPERDKTPTIAQAVTRAAVLASWPGSPALIRLCDEMADRGASLARQGREFNAFTLVAIPDDAVIRSASDIGLLAWAARLGYREGLIAGRR